MSPRHCRPPVARRHQLLAADLGDHARAPLDVGVRLEGERPHVTLAVALQAVRAQDRRQELPEGLGCARQPDHQLGAREQEHVVRDEGRRLDHAEARLAEQAVDEHHAVALDGSASADVDDGIASCVWEQTEGPIVVLSDVHLSQPSFLAPEVGPDGATDEDGEALEA